MKLKLIKASLSIICLTLLFPCDAQILNESISGFENNGESWKVDSSDFIVINDEKAASGSYSMKYEMNETYPQKDVISIDTKHTIMHVRTAHSKDGKYMVAASYEGAILGVSFAGTVLWKNELSGLMVHDLWCSDLNHDGTDEILVANADGSAYAIGGDGRTLWKYQPSEVPMNAITVVHKGKMPYVVCGGYDLAIRYLKPDGTLLKTIHSKTYSQEKPWGIDSKYDNLHYANFLRPMKKADGSEALVVNGTANHMQSSGSVYIFTPMADKPYKTFTVPGLKTAGDINLFDWNGDGNEELFFGSSQHYHSTQFAHINPVDGSGTMYPVKTNNFGYLITHTAKINDGGSDKIFALHGDQLHIVGKDMDIDKAEYLKTKYAYNGMWEDDNKILLASSQSGGSCIHILDINNPNWRNGFKTIEAKGKLKSIIENTDLLRTAIESYKKPDSQREQLPVYFIEGSQKSGTAKTVADHIKANYTSPIFLPGSSKSIAENWDRSVLNNPPYESRRDGRRDYSYSQTQVVDFFTGVYDKYGMGVWGGHGNDPYYFQLSTHKKVLDNRKGHTVLIFPELEDHSDAFGLVMEDLFYPLAEYAKTRNTQLYIRTKGNFWMGNAYLPMWKKMLDGHYPDVFVPSMEETTNKAVDMSIPARAGVWASGAVNTWGSRSVPDNPAFDRSRQFGYQRVPNHFLRHSVYMIANGATVINNFAFNPDYMSVLWSLIAKGALFVPKSNEILSYSPVHLSMHNPDEHFMKEGSDLKWNVYYNASFEQNNPYVFSRQNGTWPAAQVTEWDFSRYAMGVKDRRQNFLPPTPNGMVLITPPQEGAFVSTTAVRGKLVDHMHPTYKNILKEYYTDGRYYYSADGTQKMNANEYYTTIEQDIKGSANKLPLTVRGDAAWVVAQTSPTSIRLTLVDNGYLNPNDRQIHVTFNTVNPISMTDILDGKSFDISNKTAVEVDIPCGLFRFIDIELDAPL